MSSRGKKLFARKPTLKDTRDGSHLLVWGELAQWMVVDNELLEFQGLFNGRHTVKQVIKKHSKRVNRPISEVENEAITVIDELMQRGILSENASSSEIKPESVRIANVTINLTNKCNLRCPWCYNAGRDTDEMPIEPLMNAIECGKPIFDDNASFIVLGGEPFIQLDRLLYAMDRASEIFAPTPLVSTNGTLLTKRGVSELASRQVEVQVSLDSHDAKRHNATRGDGVFERAVDGIRRLVEAGVFTILSMVYTQDHIADIEPYLDLALELGVDEARFIPMRMIGGGISFADSAPDQLLAFEHLMDVLERRPELRPLIKRDYFTIAMTVCRYSTPRTGCGIGRKVIFIDADGKVYPCPNHVKPEHLCGDLREGSLEGIIVGSPVMKGMREQYQVTNYTRCKDCAFRYWCAGDCRGEVLSVTGDPLAPSPHCAELQRMFKRMLWLIAEGDMRLGVSQQLPDGKRTEDSFLV
jgi:radical SAM protein with 4Fe4S-binding SPASM domain